MGQVAATTTLLTVAPKARSRTTRYATRFHINKLALKKKLIAVKKRAKKLTNAKARDNFYKKLEAQAVTHEKQQNFFKPPMPSKARKASEASTASKETTSKEVHILQANVA